MSDPISGVAGGAAQHMHNAAKQQTDAGGRSFESVLQQDGGAQQTPGGQVSQAPASQLPQVPEQARLDLLQRVGSLPPGASNVMALLPELLNPRIRMNMLQQAMNGAGNTPRAEDLRGQLSKLEGDWGQMDQFMKTFKGDMSQGELLLWQQRLYQVTQHVEVLSKVVDQATGGIKTILNTNV